MEKIWQYLKNLYPENIHVVSASTGTQSATDLNTAVWRHKFNPSLSYFLADKKQLGFTYPQFSSSYIPRTAVIGREYRIKYNASGELPEQDSLITWIEELISADISTEVLSRKSAVLMQNYPNPFNPETVINYSLKKAGKVSITVYNARGIPVSTLFNGEQSAGSHVLKFDGSSLGSGVYFYRLTAGSDNLTGKMILQK